MQVAGAAARRRSAQGFGCLSPRPGGRKGEGCKKRRQEARQDTFRAKLSPSAEEFKSARPLAPRKLFYNKPMKSYPYCPPLPSGPEPTGPFKRSYSSVIDGTTAAVGGADAVVGTGAAAVGIDAVATGTDVTGVGTDAAGAGT